MTTEQKTLCAKTRDAAERILGEIEEEWRSKLWDFEVERTGSTVAASNALQGLDSRVYTIDPSSPDLDDSEREIVGEHPGAAIVICHEGESEGIMPGTPEDEIRRMIRDNFFAWPEDHPDNWETAEE